MGGYADDIEELMAQYRERRARAGALQREVSGITGTAVAPRQSVKVTANAQGEITALEFPTGGYKRMTPNELAEVITATAREAKARALDGLKAVLLPQLPAGLNFMDLIQGKADLATVFPDEPPMLDAVRQYVETGRPVPHPTRG
jgi:DNA-binding protein YbaB